MKSSWLFVLALAASLVLAGCLNPSSPPSSSNSGDDNPGTSNPGTSNPDTTNPGTSNPGTSNPGTSNPGGTNTGVTNPYDRYTRPNPPANVTATATSRSITIRWSAVSGATDYLVYRNSSIATFTNGVVKGANNQSWIHWANVKSISYTDTAVAPGTIYYYYVTSWNSLNEYGYNESSYSETVSVKTGTW